MKRKDNLKWQMNQTRKRLKTIDKLVTSSDLAKQKND